MSSTVERIIFTAHEHTVIFRDEKGQQVTVRDQHGGPPGKIDEIIIGDRKKSLTGQWQRKYRHWFNEKGKATEELRKLLGLAIVSVLESRYNELKDLEPKCSISKSSDLSFIQCSGKPLIETDYAPLMNFEFEDDNDFESIPRR